MRRKMLKLRFEKTIERKCGVFPALSFSVFFVSFISICTIEKNIVQEKKE